MSANPPHGAGGHVFDLRCDECHANVSAKMEADFIESMLAEGLTREQAVELRDKAVNIGQRLRAEREAEES